MKDLIDFMTKDERWMAFLIAIVFMIGLRMCAISDSAGHKYKEEILILKHENAILNLKLNLIKKEFKTDDTIYKEKN